MTQGSAVRAGCGAALAFAAALTFGTGAGSAYEGVLRFERSGVFVREIDAAALAVACAARPVEVEADPYYEKRKQFLACPLESVLELGFGEDRGPAGRSYIFRARDGYTKVASAARVAESGGWVALADLGDGPVGARSARSGDAWGSWEPIGRAAVDPGPFYVVWTGADQADVHRYPWPYQLVAIEIASFESLHPHTVPRGAGPGSPARSGFEIFRSECVSCHAINGEGGKVGPDLNVPRSIVEYRPVAQIRAFIRDPQSFRYTSMPSHPHLSQRDLDALVAYFQVMKGQKYDPASESRVEADAVRDGSRADDPVGSSAESPARKPNGS